MGNYSDSKTYAQYQWLKKDLESVDRCKTPWVIAMTHRPMYSSQVSGYQANIRAAFEKLLLEYSVDAYLSGYHSLPLLPFPLRLMFGIVLKKIDISIGMNVCTQWDSTVQSITLPWWIITPTSLTRVSQ